MYASTSVTAQSAATATRDFVAGHRTARCYSCYAERYHLLLQRYCYRKVLALLSALLSDLLLHIMSPVLAVSDSDSNSGSDKFEIPAAILSSRRGARSAATI